MVRDGCPRSASSVRILTKGSKDSCVAVGIAFLREVERIHARALFLKMAEYTRRNCVRFIQAILGHTSLNSTAIYTQSRCPELVEIHERMHPAAVLKRKPRTGTSEPEAPRRRWLFSLLSAMKSLDEHS